MLANTAEVELVAASPVDDRNPVMDGPMASVQVEVAERPMAAARGIFTAVLMSIPIWMALALVVYMFR
jgi:hypothetical protein